MPIRAEIILFLIFPILITTQAFAEKLYRASDEKGNLVFSDRPLAGTRVQEVRQVEVSKEPCFSVQKSGEESDLRLLGVNNCYGPVQVGFRLDDAENVTLNRSRSFQTVLPARQSTQIVRLRQADRRQGYRYTYTTFVVLGDPEATYRSQDTYLLPIPPGRRFRVSQAFHGESTHTHPQSEYAVDIPMPEGTEIYASRAGVIMDVALDFFTGGKEERFGEKANFIRILHDDGTMAIYAHLALESIRYPAGTRVERGQFIAKSGNTGYSSGPHLHFAVQKNFGMDLRSIPFRFLGDDGASFVPLMGMTISR